MLIKVCKMLSFLTCSVGGAKVICNPHLPCQWPGLPLSGVSGKVRSGGKFSLTTQLVPILHHLLDQAAQSLNFLIL